jgi:hypothetical protein
MPTPIEGTPGEGTGAAKEPVINNPTKTTNTTSTAGNQNPANPGETVVVVKPSGPEGETTVEGTSALHGTFAPVNVAPPPKPDPGVNSGMGPKNDNYDDHPGLGIDGLV